MRVGLIIYGSLETVSGGFLYDRMLVQHLRGRGDRVEVISLGWPSYGRGLLDNLSPSLLRRLRRAAFDVLLQDELAHPSLFRLNYRLRRTVPYPLVAIVHHLRADELRPAWQNHFYRAVERRYLRAMDGFICNSRSTQAAVESLVGNSLPKVLAYPAGDRLDGALTSEQITSRVRQTGPRELVFVGNLIPRKGLHTLLTALAGLTRPDWRLTVAGSLEADPAYARSINSQMSRLGLTERVRLAGTLNPPELSACLRRSHLLVVPSSYEGFGIVYLEGMQFGLPALGSSAGGAGEIIQHGVNGFLVPPEDAGTLGSYLRQLLEDRELLLCLSLAAQAHFARHPTWEESMERIYFFLHNAV